MKKLQFFAAAALAFFATACSNEVDAPDTQSGTETEVAVTLQLPQEIQTYAYGDGTKAPRLHYAVYPHTTDGTVPAPVITGDNENAFPAGALTTTQNFKVITGIEYDFVFFADNADGQFVFDTATATITDQDAEDGVIDGNKENRDAFFGVLTLKVTGPFSASVELRRPFAQLNLGSGDLRETVVTNTFGSDLAKLKTSVTTDTYKTLNLLTGVASDKVSVAFGKSDVPDSSVEAYPVDGYDFLSMNYLLMPAELTRQNCVFTIYNTDTEVRSFTVPNVPVQRNYRTNVYGNVLTTDGDVNITINPVFDDPDHEANADNYVVLADGVVQDKDNKNVFMITNVNGFEWISDQVEANIAYFYGKTIELSADLDMENKTVKPWKLWAPENPITFDGKGHTIKNVKFAGSYKSLIESTTGTVKNLNIDGMNATLAGGSARRFCGIVANSYGNFENIHVKNANMSTGDGRIGVIVGIHNGGNMTNCSIENVTVKGAWSVGGMIGAINETTTGRVYTNLVCKNVKVTNTGGYGGVYDKMTGVIVGNINLDGVSFVDCQIIDCDTTMPIYNSFVDYTWNGTLIKADIDDSGNPLPVTE